MLAAEMVVVGNQPSAYENLNDEEETVVSNEDEEALICGPFVAVLKVL